MKMLIVARTKMGGSSRCIGSLAQSGDSVRLLTAAGENHTTASPLHIGEVWDIAYTPRPNRIAPHVEDALVTRETRVGAQPNLRQHLLTRVNPWRGSIDELFGGVLGYTGSGNGYISEALGVPDRSIGFWVPDRDLVLRADGKHYDYDPHSRGLSYVGEPEAIPRIPAGTLVRVSLARWWKPRDADPAFEERCYLQLSGWY